MKISFFCVLLIGTLFAKEEFTTSPMHPNSIDEAIVSRIVSEDSKEIIIEYKVPKPTFTPNINQQTTEIRFGNTKRDVSTGAPVIPYVVSKVLLPLDKGVDKLTIIKHNTRERKIQTLLEYGTAKIRISDPASARSAHPLPEIYNAAIVYPKESIKLHSIQKRKGVPYAIIKMYPLLYYPSLSSIRYSTHFTVQITLKEKSPGHEQLRTMLKNFDLSDFENPGTLQRIPNNSTHGDALNENCRADTYNYVIITNNALKQSSTKPNIQSLAAQRRKNGLQDTIVTVEDIYQNYEGADKPEKIRNFIKDAYNNWKTEFVLLGGDVNIVPTRFINVVDGPVTQVATNAYYQCLDGSYNDNNNNLWGEANDGENGGEIDFSPDINIGRASVENATELSNFIAKVLKYENDKRTGDNYITQATFVGEKLMNLKDSVSYGKFYMDEIKDGSDFYDYSTLGFAECTDIDEATVYKFDDDWPSDGLEKQKLMRDKINTNEIGYINHLGHSTLKKNMKMYRGQEDSLTNSNPIFHYSQGCFVGQFEDDCFGERFICSNKQGMWSAVLNSHWGIGRKDNRDGASQNLHREFWDAHFKEKKYYVGECMADQREDHIHRIANNVEDPERWSFFVCNLLGAPATKFRIYENNTENLICNKHTTHKIHTTVTKTASAIHINIKGVTTPNASLSLFTLSGRLITSKKYNISSKQQISLPFTDFSPGVYLYQLKINTTTINKRLLIP